MIKSWKKGGTSLEIEKEKKEEGRRKRKEGGEKRRGRGVHLKALCIV